MLAASSDLIGERLAYCLDPDNDTDIIRSFKDGLVCLKFVSPLNIFISNFHFYSIIMYCPEITLTITFYEDLYQIDEDGHFTGMRVDNPHGLLYNHKFDDYSTTILQ